MGRFSPSASAFVSFILAALFKTYRFSPCKMTLRGGDYHVNHPTFVHLMDKDGRHVWFNHRAPSAAAEIRSYL